MTAVARALADDTGDLDSAFRSKVQYNVGLLEERELLRFVDDGY